jgi:hypothetical protein
MAIHYIKDNALRIALLAALLFIWKINYHSNGHFSLCLFRLLLDEHCYGCGTLRGASAVLHLDWKTAYNLNPLNAATLPLLGWIFSSAWIKNRF